jgi:Skp family chaperone for outer membrane proteins
MDSLTGEQNQELVNLANQIDNGTIPVDQQVTTKTEEEVKPEAERLAAKFAEVARRNAMLRKQKMQIAAPIKEKDSELEKLRAEVERLKKYDTVTDPMELLNLKGIKYVGYY